MKICVNSWLKNVAKTKNNAFTIVELLVAMSLLVILVGLSSVVFSLTVKSQRSATASIEITRSLRVLTDQLNADFRGLKTDAPVFIKFNNNVGVDKDGDAVDDYYSDFDTIHFFADGDFQTMNQYDDGSGSKTISGNLARIFYGHANSVDLIADSTATVDFGAYRTLARKTHILTADNGIQGVYSEIPLISNWPTIPYALDYSQFNGSFGQTPVTMTGRIDSDENAREFNTITLSQWINALNFNTTNANAFIAQCMDDNSRPLIDLSTASARMATLHLLMAQGVSGFTVQWAYTNDDLIDTATGLAPNPPEFAGVRWWPSVDPDGLGTEPSDFVGMNGANPFGVFFTLPNGVGTPIDPWFSIGNCKTSIGGTAYPFSNAFYPKALKFTFTLHDSNGMYEEGKTFTHIVYLDN